MNQIRPARARLYLVTGGAGFIGSHLVDALLADGHAVRILDDLSTGRTINRDPRCEFVRGDVADLAAVQEAMAGAAGCFHLAAIASVARGNEDWLGTHRCNQTGTVTVLECARQLGGVPVVYASSAAVYGNAGEDAIAETCPTVPLTAYGADKLGSELHARVAHHVHGVPTLGLRFFNVYGPRQDPDSPYSGVISIFAKRVAAGLPISIHGDGGQTRDFVFVGDVVAHLRAAMRHLQQHGGTGVQNVCTGRAVTVRELATRLVALRDGIPDLLFTPARAGDIRHSCGNPESTTTLFGLRADTPLEVGLDILLRDGECVSAE
jgi:UDP-glucose 4-epimerase